MTRLKNYIEVQSYISQIISTQKNISDSERNLLRTVLNLTRKFEDNELYNTRKMGFPRSFFKINIDFNVVNELCLRLHLSLAYQINYYDRDQQINFDEHLAN